MDPYNRLALFAWEGNPMHGFYVVPEEDAEIFERLYSDAPWVRMDGIGPKNLLLNLRETERLSQ
jgi:hypothetical protein